MAKKIFVSSLNQMPEIVAKNNITHLVSVLSKTQSAKRPNKIEAQNHLQLNFNDTVEKIDGFELAKSNDIKKLLEFSKQWVSQKSGDLLVHCWMGISRAPACSYIMSCHLMAQENEKKIAQNLREKSPYCTPNSHLIKLADQALNREGKMIQAIAEIGRGKDYQEMSFFLEQSF